MKCAIKPTRTLLVKSKAVVINKVAEDLEEEEEEEEEEDEDSKLSASGGGVLPILKDEVTNVLPQGDTKATKSLVDKDGTDSAMDVDVKDESGKACCKDTMSCMPSAKAKESADIPGSVDLSKAPVVSKFAQPPANQQASKLASQQPKTSIEVATKTSSSASGNRAENDSKKKKNKTAAVGIQKVGPNVSSFEPLSDEFSDTWMPPSGQSGDGRTQLNSKFGY